MADPLSMASAIAGLVSLADVVLTKTYHYLLAVKSAEKDIKDLRMLLESMYGTMNALKTRLRVLDSLSTTSTSLYTRPGIIDDCTRLLDDINQKLAHYDFGKNTSKMKKQLQKLRWPFESSQTRELVDRLSRFNEVLVTALQGDTLSAVHETFRAASGIRDDIKKLERSLSIKINNLVDFELDKAQQEAFNYYNRCDPTSRHEAAKRLCQQGTGKWFTESDSFTSWFEGPRSKLWLSGIPGAGKTILASSIIQRARLQVAQLVDSSALVYFYCDYKEPQTHEIDNILSTIAAQLGRQSTDAMALLSQQYAKFHKPGRGSTFEEAPDLTNTILSLYSCYQNVFLIVDGLDECGQNVDKVTKQLKTIAGSANTTTHCVFLSRGEFEIEHMLLPDFQEIKIAAQSYDLKLFVHSRLEDIDDDDPDFKNEILETLINKADGMFRWVACQIDYLRDLPSIEERKRALHELPPDLNSAYDRILERVNRKPSSTQEMVHLTLTWLICGESSDLDFAGLREALAIRYEQTKLQRGKIPNEQTVLRHCSSFVRRSAFGNRIEPAHFTVAEYLTQIPVSHPTLSRYRIDKSVGVCSLAKLCLTYLRFEDFRDAQSVSQAEQRGDEYRFRKHAVQEWATYARHELEDEALFTMVVDFCSDTSSANHVTWLFDYIWYQTRAYYRWSSQKMRTDYKQLSPYDIEVNLGDEDNNTENLILAKMRGWAPIHCASFLCLPEIVKHFSQEGADVLLQSAVGNPVQLALLNNSAFSDYSIYYARPLYHGFCQTVQILFEAGADVASKWYNPVLREHKYDLELVFDASMGSEQRAKIVALMLNAGLCLNQQIVGSLKRPSLNNLYALFPSVIKLDHVQDDYKAEWLDATRQYSTSYGCDTLTTSIDAAQQDVLHALLRSAARSNQASDLETLLSRQDININAVDDKGRTALSLAAEQGSLQALRLLLDRGADVNISDASGLTPFHYSMCSGTDGAIEMIHNFGARTDLEDSKGELAWSYAGRWGNIAALKLFQAEYEESEQSYCSMLAKENSVLFAAAKAGQDEAVLLLTQITGATAVCNPEGRNLAHYIKNMKTGTFRKLIDLELNCTQRDHHGRTPLHTLCAEGLIGAAFCEKIEILLQKDCTITDICNAGNTPLHLLFKNRSAVLDNQILKLLCSGAVLGKANSAGHNPFDFLLLYRWSFPIDFDLAFYFLRRMHARPASKDSCDEWQRVLLANDGRRITQASHVLRKLLEVLSPMHVLEFRDVIESVGRWAALNLKSDLLQTALDLGADVCKRGKKVSSASILELVCTRVQATHIVERVLRDINTEQIAQLEVKEPLLHLACSYGKSNPVVITELLRKGLDINEQRPVDGHTPLMVAIIHRQNRHIRVLLEAKADVRICDYFGWNVFAHTFASNEPSIIQQLLDYCNDDNLWWKRFNFSQRKTATATGLYLEGASILHVASSRGKAIVLEMMFSRWPELDPNQLTQDKLTPLHIACTSTSSSEAVKLLVSAKANVHARDMSERIPLHMAASYSSLETVRILLESGSDINAINDYGDTPLHMAVERGDISIVDHLLKEGAISTSSNAIGFTPELLARRLRHNDVADMVLRHCAEKTENATSQSETRSELERLKFYNSFIKAIPSGDKKLITKMSKMVDSSRDLPCSGCTPITVALRSGDVELTILLLDLGYSVRSFRCVCSNNNGYNAMQQTAAKLDLEMVIEELFSQIHQDDQQRLLASHEHPHPAIVAVTHNNLLYLKKCLERFRGLSLEDRCPVSLIKTESNTKGPRRPPYPAEYWDPLKYKSGAGLLHVAAAHNHLDIVKFLSVWQILLDCTDDNLATPLHYAALSGAVETIDYLLDAGADIEARTSWGTTPLYLAALYCQSAAIHLLLDRGARTQFSNAQVVCESAIFEDSIANSAILAADLSVCDFDTFQISTSSFTKDLTSIYFVNNAIIAMFKKRHWALGHYILFNGIFLLKHVLKWLKLHEALKQQLDFSTPSALCLAAQHGDIEVVENLLDYGSDIDSIGCEEGPAVMIACKSNRLGMVKFLVRRGAKLSYKDANGRELSCFEAAGRYQHIVQWLLVGRYNDQRRLNNGEQSDDPSCNPKSPVRIIKPWSGLHTVKSPLPPEFKQARGDTLLDWHIRKRRDLQEYEGKILHYGEGIVYPFFNYE